MNLLHLSPRQYPTWAEANDFPATPEQMHIMLTSEMVEGCRGEFGHHYWGEHHPSFNGHLMGFVWLPGISMYEVPRNLRTNTIVDKHGKVFLRAVVDEAGYYVPA